MPTGTEVRIRFDHVSLAVHSITRAVDFFRRYFPIAPRNDKQISEQASGRFLWQDFFLGGAVIEVIEALPEQPGFIAEFIRRHGEGMHHLSFEVDRLEPLVARFKRAGLRIVDEYQLDDGQRTAFISPRSALGCLIQFWQPLDYDHAEAWPTADGMVRFDHLALAVRDVRRAMDFFGQHLGATIRNPPMPSSSQGDFILGHVELGGLKLELIQSPPSAAPDNFVQRFIDRYGEGLHHLTVDVRDFARLQEKLKQDGIRLVGRASNWRGERQFFISPQAAFGTLIQVWDGLGGSDPLGHEPTAGGLKSTIMGQQLRAVFFDAAGTLFETRQPVGLSYAMIAREYGVETSADAVNAAFRQSFHNARPLAFGPGRSAQELRQLEREWWRELVARTFAALGQFNDFEAYFNALFAFFADPAQWVADPMAAGLLVALHERGLVLGVISNFDYRLYGILQGLGLSQWFDSVTISSEAGFAKPSARLFETALQRHAVASAQALHIGDSEALDLVGAAGAGLAAILVDPKASAEVAVRGRTARIRSLGAALEAAHQLGYRSISLSGVT